jgi:glycosyltransferase involved in cell wall biosynthesis
MTGVDIYLKQLILHLAKVDTDNQYLIVLNFEDRELFKRDLPESFSCVCLSARPRPIRLIFQQALLPIAALLWKADLVHSPAFIMPYVRGSSRHVLTIQDMTSFSHPECHNALRRSSLYLRLVRTSVERTDGIIVPSRATKKAVMDFMPEVNPDRIYVTALGISEEFRLLDPAYVENITSRLELPKSYILYVGTLEPRKNLPALVESFRRLVEAGEIKEDLVIAGKLGWGYDELLQQIDVPVLRGRVHLAGYVDQKDLPAIYAGARLFVYPSLFEGFGFPPLEAMACGVPTISTKTSSLIENLKDAAELVPAGDIEALTDSIKLLLTDTVLWEKRRLQGLELAGRYRWENTARDTLKCFERTLATAQRKQDPVKN